MYEWYDLPRGRDFLHAPTIEDYGVPTHECVVVTGPRFWDTLVQEDLGVRLAYALLVMIAERDRNGPYTLVHGNALGTDRRIAAMLQSQGFETIAVPYFGWLRGGGGPARNRFMLTAYKPRIVHGFHDRIYEELPQPGSGTADCVRAALELGINVDFHVPVLSLTTSYRRAQTSLT